MFKFTSTVIVNSDKDSSGVAKWVAGENSFNFRRGLNFKKGNVVSIYKRAYSDPRMAKAILDVTNLTEGSYRLTMYIRLSGSQESYYANDFVFKGKPFQIEFAVKNGESAAQVATKLANFINKMQRLYDMKMLSVSAKGNTVEIVAIDEYQRFQTVKIEKFDSSKGILETGRFVDEIVAHEVSHEDYDGANTIIQGIEGFGTWFMLTKNMHLPTAENNRFAGLNQEERPIMGAHYNQYTVYYSVDRGIVGGAGAVGEKITSITCHVFFVREELAASFEAGLANVGTIMEVNGVTSFSNLKEVVATDAASYANLPADYIAANPYEASKVPAVGFTFILDGPMTVTAKVGETPVEFSNILASVGTVSENGEILSVNGPKEYLVFHKENNLSLTDANQNVVFTFTQGGKVETKTVVL